MLSSLKAFNISEKQNQTLADYDKYMLWQNLDLAQSKAICIPHVCDILCSLRQGNSHIFFQSVYRENPRSIIIRCRLC